MEALVEPAVAIMIESVLEGDVVVVCGREPVTAFVVVVAFLICAYRITLLEAFLALRQNQVIPAVDPRILAAIQLWMAARPTTLFPAKASQNQYGCFCARSAIKLAATIMNDPVRPCACEVGCFSIVIIL
jgi:hypothetical protein